MLNPKIAKPEVCRHFPNWPPPPSRKSFNCSYSAFHHPILMNFGTQTKENMLSPKNATPEVCRHFTRLPPPPS
jgi:hypothetical protein